jgi:hypothetical protein
MLEAGHRVQVPYHILAFNLKKEIVCVFFFYQSSSLVSARIYRPSFHENKPKTLVFND